VSGLNPKVLLLFLALLPQFTDSSAAWPVAVQIIALGLIHAFSCGVVYLAVGYGARAVLTSRPGAALNVSRISGAAMIVIAVVLAAERLTI
jgi:threonine/homoserine/homoserine lactone efflux protein